MSVFSLGLYQRALCPLGVLLCPWISPKPQCAIATRLHGQITMSARVTCSQRDHARLYEKTYRAKSRASLVCAQKKKIVKGKILSIIGTFSEHNRYFLWAVQHSIIGRFLSIISSPLLPPLEVLSCEATKSTTGMDLDFRVGIAEATVGLAYKCKLLMATLHWAWVSACPSAKKSWREYCVSVHSMYSVLSAHHRSACIATVMFMCM